MQPNTSLPQNQLKLVLESKARQRHVASGRRQRNGSESFQLHPHLTQTRH